MAQSASPRPALRAGRETAPASEPTAETLRAAYDAAEAAYQAGKTGTSAAYDRAYEAAYAVLAPVGRGDSWDPDRIAAYVEATQPAPGHPRRWTTTPARAQCPGCGVFHSAGPAHVCVVYDGPPCVTCGQPTVCYQVGAPGYGTGRACAGGHHEHLTPHGIYTPGDVR